jgi:acyl-CoA synthetase (AMP-forming)/AMP-acid ligase II
MDSTLAPRIWEINGAAPSGLALADGRCSLTWAELEARTNALGRGIESLGIPPGSHIVLASSNRAEFIETLIGAMRAGMIVTPVKTSWTAEELGHVLADAGTRLVVTDLDNPVRAARAAGVPVLDLNEGFEGEGFEAWLSRQDDAPLPRARTGIRMSYTSGTTGRPKGVMRIADTPRPWCEAFAASRAFKEILAVPTNGPHLNVSALFHGAPSFSLALMANGAPLVILPRWDAARRWRSPTASPPWSRRCSVSSSRCPGVRGSFEAPELRVILHGGEPCPQPLKRQMIDWLGPILVEYYGMTEGGLTVATAEEWLARPGTVGRAKLGMSARVVAEAGHDLPPGEEGTIYFATRARPSSTATSPARRRERIAPMGHSRSATSAMDADGYLFISTRGGRDRVWRRERLSRRDRGRASRARCATPAAPRAGRGAERGRGLVAAEGPADRRSPRSKRRDQRQGCKRLRVRAAR